MSNEKCGCEYLETDPKKVEKFTDRTRIEEIVRKIPLFFSENMFAKVVQLAVLLPPRREIEKILESNAAIFNLDMSEIRAGHAKNIYNTMIAIEASHSLLIRSGLYKQEVSLIEDLAKLTPLTEEGEGYWRKELLNALLKDEGLNKSIEIWRKNYEEVKKLTELFHLPLEEVKGICKKAINESKETEPSKCISVAKEMYVPIYLQEYRVIASVMMGLANCSSNCNERRELTKEACETFKLFANNFKEDPIWKRWEETGHTEKTIKEASKIVGFKYKPHGLWGHTVGRL